MAITVKHTKVSTIPDGDDSSLIRPSDWNADHQLVGQVPIANGGTGATTANDAFNALAPTQTGNNGKYLTTDGTNTSWATNPLGTVTSVATGTGLSGGPITTSGTISFSNTAVGTWAATPTSANLAAAVSDETGSGSLVFGTGPTLNNPNIANYEAWTGASAPSYTEGLQWYDSTAHSLAYYNDSPNSIVHIGQDIQVKVINNTGSTIPNGSPVYITSTSSGQTYPNVALAKADVAATSSVIGLTNGAIANGAIGYVTSQGGIDNVNTGSFTVGQVLYLSPYSAGQLMNTIPPTGITVQVGVVSYVNSSTGKIYVKQTTPLAVPASIITGTLAVNQGGTGVQTITGYIKGSGTSAFTGSSTIPTTDLSGTITNAQLANSTITINGNSTALGGSVSVGTVTSVAATAGTGISVSGSPITSSGTLTITNTAPDQTVVLTAGTGISTSGTYPNFTIANSGVTSVTGTASQVTVSASTGGVTLSLPSTINVNTSGSAAKWTTARTESLTGDITGSTTVDGSANYSIATTLATVNSNVGTYTKITINGKGLATAGSQASLTDLSSPTTSFSFGSQNLTNLLDPVGAQDAATKNYVDTVAQGLDAKASCVAGTTVSITLVGGQVIDGVTVVAGDRVLVKNQSSASANGIYVVQTTAWTRALDMDTWAEVPGSFVFVEQGTTQADTGWVCTSNGGGTIGTTPITFTQFSGAGTYTAGTGLTLTGTQFSITNTGTAGTYGSATQTPVLTTNAQGQVTSVTNTTITPAVGSITGLGTGVATALAVNTGSSGAFVVNGGALGTPSSGTVTNLTGTASININGTVGATTPAAGTFTSVTLSGVSSNLNGDFSNATVLSRSAFKTTTTNGSTGIYALPNGTSTAASWQASNAADPTNASKILIATNGSTDVQLVSGINGTGTYLPMTFWNNGSEKMRLSVAGGLAIGSASDAGAGNLLVQNTITATKYVGVSGGTF